MSLLLIAALLAQTPERAPLPSKDRLPTAADEAWTREHARELGLEKPKSQPEFVITPATGWAPGATKRFVGAFLGGLVGMAIPAALAAATAPPCMGLCGFATVAGLVTAASAPLSVVGATLGFTLMGGRMSAGAAIAGSLGGLGSGLLLLLFSTLSAREPNATNWGAVIAASALTAALEALALEARSDTLDEAPFLEVNTSRLVFTSLGMLTALGASVGLAALTLATGYLAVLFGPIVLVAAAAIVPIVPWSIHRGMGGEGSLGAAYLGWLASLAVGGAGVFAAFMGVSLSVPLVSVDPRMVALVGGGIGLAAMAAVLGTPLMLEWSHGQAHRERAKVAPAVQAQVSVAPIAGPQGLAGGTLGLAGTF